MFCEEKNKMRSKEAEARIKINKLLEDSNWRETLINYVKDYINLNVVMGTA